MPHPAPHVPLAERAAPPLHLDLPTAGGLSWRPVTATDAGALVELENASLAAAGAILRWSLEEMVELLAEPWLGLPDNSLIGHDGGGVARAWALAHRLPADQTLLRVLADGCVHPDRRGEGIGREVLAWTVGRARQLLAASGRDLPAVIRTSVDDTAPEPVHRLLRHAGFQPQRFFADLQRDLAEPVPEVALTGSLRLVPWTAELDEPTRLAHNDAFRDHWGSQPQSAEQWTSGRAMFVPGWSFIVVDDDPDTAGLLASPDTDGATASTLAEGQPLVVGYHLASRYTADFAVRGHSFGYTDILGVRRGYRGRRIAPALLTAGMRAFRDDGMEYAVLDVDTENPTGAYGLYSRLGYAKVHGYTAYAIDL